MCRLSVSFERQARALGMESPSFFYAPTNLLPSISFFAILINLTSFFEQQIFATRATTSFELRWNRCDDKAEKYFARNKTFSFSLLFFVGLTTFLLNKIIAYNRWCFYWEICRWSLSTNRWTVSSDRQNNLSWNGCENFTVKNYVRNVDNFCIIRLE